MFDINSILKVQDRVFDLLSGARRRSLERYALTINELHRVDVSDSKYYKTNFNAFYRMGKRNSDWYRSFYEILEREKGDKDIKFKAVLVEIFDKTGRVEPSFSSKLIATINPKKAVYDSVVRKNFDIKNRLTGSKDRIPNLERDYEEIQSRLDSMIILPQFRKIREQFNIKFSEFDYFTDIKVLDLIIWQIRDQK